MNMRSRLPPEVILAGLFLILSCWYLNDAYNASSSAENLLLILPPAAIVVICLCLWIIGRTLYEVNKARTQQIEDKEEEKEEKKAGLCCRSYEHFSCFCLKHGLDRV